MHFRIFKYTVNSDPWKTWEIGFDRSVKILAQEEISTLFTKSPNIAWEVVTCWSLCSLPQEPRVSNYRIFSVLCSQMMFDKIIFSLFHFREIAMAIWEGCRLHLGTQWFEDFCNLNSAALHYNFYRRLFINIKPIKGQSVKFLYHCCHLCAVLREHAFIPSDLYNSKLSVSFIKWLLDSTAPTNIAKPV